MGLPCCMAWSTVVSEGLPHVRVMVARHPAPPPGKSVTVGNRARRNAWSGPTQWHITLAGVPAFLAINSQKEASANQETNAMMRPIPLSGQGHLSTLSPLYYVLACLQCAWMGRFIKETRMP